MKTFLRARRRHLLGDGNAASSRPVNECFMCRVLGRARLLYFSRFPLSVLFGRGAERDERPPNRK